MTIPLPEWAPHEALWIGFPSDRSLWAEDLAPAQQEVVEFARAIHADGEGEARVPLAVAVWGDEAEAGHRVMTMPCPRAGSGARDHSGENFRRLG